MLITEKNVINWSHLKVKNFCMSRHHEQIARETHGVRVSFAHYPSEIGLVSSVKNIKESSRKKADNPMAKSAKELSRHLRKNTPNGK